MRARGPAGPLTDFRVLDRSPGGLALASDYPLLIGSRLVLTLDAEGESFEIEVVVRWRSDRGTPHRFGVEFLTRDPRLARLLPLLA